jgi:F-type H+-transporting ATPase subunit a
MLRRICLALLFPTFLYPWASDGYSRTSIQEDHQADSASVTHETGLETEETEVFNPKDFIFDHIKDAHEWHIMTIGHTHVTIPLPVIVYSKTSGLNIFMSSRFRHGEESYKGFHLGTEGLDKNKILEEDGTKPLDFSLTKNIVSLIFSVLLILLIFLNIGKAYRKNPVSAPSGLQSWFEPIIVFLLGDIIKPSIGPKYERYAPYLLTLFFFIWINNMLGLIPIPPFGANVTGNIAVTLTLAFCTFLVTNITGTKAYWKHIFNTPGVPWWLKLPIPVMPLVEAIGIFVKPITLMIRLFANMTAGHVMVMAFIMLIYLFAEMSTGLAYGISVVSVLFNVFLTMLELLVAFIQAFIFTFLSSIYFGLASAEPHEEHHKEHA